MKRVSNKIIENFKKDEGICSLGNKSDPCILQEHCNAGLHCKDKKCVENKYICNNGKPITASKDDKKLLATRGDIEECLSCNKGSIASPGGYKLNSTTKKCDETVWTCEDNNINKFKKTKKKDKCKLMEDQMVILM